MENEIDKNLERDVASEKEPTDPKKLLLKVAKLCEGYIVFPIESLGDGNFAGLGTLKIEDEKVLLVRLASDVEHLVKSGKDATAQEMRDSSEYMGGAPMSGACHTSALVDSWGAGGFSNYNYKGIFKIPVDDFVRLAREHKLMIGNLGEGEIIVSGKELQKYLDNVEVLDKQREKGDIEGAIQINFS